MRSNKPLFVIGTLFFVFGFVTWLGSVLIPYLRIACQLNNLASYFVAFSFYISYMVMAIPAASVLRGTGYKKGMAIGLFIMAVGAALFLPAAQAKSYPLFLAGLFVQGTGLALLQTASNPYITILGPMETAAKRISIMGICNGIAGVVAPLILGAVILKDADSIKESLIKMSGPEKTETLNNLANRVIFPYSIIVVALILLALLVLLSGLPEMNAEAEDSEAAPVGTDKTSIFQFPHLLLGALTLFLYVGVEVIAGDTIINYGASQGIPLSSAKFFTSCTLLLMLAGYVIGIIVIPKYLSQQRVLKISAVMGLIFSSVALLTKGYVSVAFIALLGLANSMIWPSIWPLAINKLGKFTKIGSSFLIVAIGGGAILPLLYGWLADFQSITTHYAYAIVMPCYLIILFYAIKGHKIGIGL
ncbi:MAG: sugar MFS transporter [Bacteroidetes bacterium]|nr:sugar MFS transporter [Bacteroidota bacterium]MBS1975067.1 sugar MFS transporter [Bacteroidota bacterium]